MTRETLGFNCGYGRWNIEYFSSFRESNDIVFEGLAIDTLYTESHLWLMIDKDHLTILRS
jgi:hypothetical protein